MKTVLSRINNYYDELLEQIVGLIKDTDKKMLETSLTPSKLEKYRAGEITRDTAEKYASIREEKLMEKEKNKKLEWAKEVMQYQSPEFINITVIYTKNRVVAEVRSLNDNGWIETSGFVGGYGYDRESAAIASAFNENKQVMRALFDAFEKYDTLPYGVSFYGKPMFDSGVGVSCFRDLFTKIGYNWESFGTKTTTTYVIKKI